MQFRDFTSSWPFRVLSVCKALCVLPSLVVTGCAFNTPGPYRYVDWEPAYSPDGAKIAFIGRRPTSENPRGRDRFWIMDADGSNQRCLLRREQAIGRPLWAPDGSALVLVTGSDITQQYQCVWVDLRGRIVRRFECPVNMQPLAIHPNGKNLIWSDWQRLWFSDLDGQNMKRICELFPGHHYSASDDWSRAVYNVYYRPRGNGVYAVDLQQRTVQFRCRGEGASISPDGRLIAYVRDQQDIVVMGFDGQNPRVVLHHPLLPQQRPKFLADGTRLLVWGPPETEGASAPLTVVNVDGTALMRLDLPPLFLLEAVLSPDGTRILGVGGPRMNWGFYQAQLDGAYWVRLSPNAWDL